MAGDRMSPALRHGESLPLRPVPEGPIAPGTVVLAVPGGVPDVLIFDLANSNESHILPLLLKNPGLLLIGLDTESNQAVLVSGKEAQSLTLNQIREIIERG